MFMDEILIWKYIREDKGGWSVFACPKCGEELRIPHGETPGYNGIEMCFSCHALVYDDERGSTYEQFINGVL